MGIKGIKAKRLKFFPADVFPISPFFPLYPLLFISAEADIEIVLKEFGV